MFKGETAISLGALALLRHQINFLNDQSPLPKKSQNKIKEENIEQICTTTNATKSLSDHKVRCKNICSVIFKLCYPCRINILKSILYYCMTVSLCIEIVFPCREIGFEYLKLTLNFGTTLPRV